MRRFPKVVAAGRWILPGLLPWFLGAYVAALTAAAQGVCREQEFAASDPRDRPSATAASLVAREDAVRSAAGGAGAAAGERQDEADGPAGGVHFLSIDFFNNMQVAGGDAEVARLFAGDGFHPAAYGMDKFWSPLVADIALRHLGLKCRPL